MIRRMRMTARKGNIRVLLWLLSVLFARLLQAEATRVLKDLRRYIEHSRSLPRQHAAA